MECKSSGVLPHSRDFGLWSRRSGRCPLWLEICASPETALAQVVFRPLVLRRSVQAACSKRRLFFICMSLKVQEVHEIAAAAAAPGGAPVPWELGAGSQPGETPGARVAGVSVLSAGGRGVVLRGVSKFCSIRYSCREGLAWQLQRVFSNFQQGRFPQIVGDRGGTQGHYKGAPATRRECGTSFFVQKQQIRNEVITGGTG
jgi:hypothetical protein